MAVNKVEYDGNTLMDITDTTATAGDVASGKVFYGANGVRTTGTSSGGGGSPTDVQINGTSITSSGVADISTVGTYDSSSNPIATMDDVYDGINTVSQSSDFVAYISQIVAGLIPSGTEIMVNTFEDLPTENVTEYSKAYVKNATLYDVTTIASLNFDITQMHDSSPLAEPNYSQITSTSNFSIYYEDIFERTFLVALLPGNASGILLFGYNSSMGNQATNMTPGYVHTDGNMPGIAIPEGWSILDPETQASVSITFNEVPLIPVYLYSVTGTEGNPVLANNFFVDAKKHWAGEYRYINGEWKYQQTIKTPYLEINNMTVPTSTALYETINAGSNKIIEELGALAEQVEMLNQEINGGGN